MAALKPLYIIGAGGFGREAAWLVERVNTVSPVWDFRGFLDDDSSLWGTEADGFQIYGGHEVLGHCQEDVWCVFAVGNAKARQRGVRRLQSFGHVKFATLVDPKADIGRSVTVGEGSIICAGTIITVGVRIGSHNIINLDCTVGHDTVLEDFVTLYPSANVSGCVKIGRTTEVGTGAKVIQGIGIGSGSIIGAGATVICDIEPDVTAVGSPARVIKCHGKPRRNSGIERI